MLKKHEKNNNKPHSKDTTKMVQILKLRETILIILNLIERRENERKMTSKFLAEKFSNSIIFLNCVVDFCLFAEYFFADVVFLVKLFRNSIFCSITSPGLGIIRAFVVSLVILESVV